MNKIVSLLQKLWQGKITPEEADRLNGLMKENDGELKLFFNRPVEEPGIINTSAKETLEKLLLKINKHENKKARVVSLQRKTIWWAAASIIVAVVGFQFFNYTSNNKAINQPIATSNKKETVPLKVISNTTDSNQQIILADQSVITIYPKSTISYYEAFNGNERNISLAGKALFKVAKDKQRPFTVYANGIATTALGTQFTVSTLVKNRVEVKLFEGKVVVRPTGKNNYAINEVYLLPGQLVTVNKLTQLLAVTSFENINSIAKRSQSNNKTVVGSIMLQFDNETLLSVFEKLQVKYNIDINYDKTQIDGLYFTGSVLKTDSLKTILSIISNMNGLKYTEVAGKIFITK
jgi:ferric-dicitrate binding protein FerR (iron transport regulator)